MEQEYRDRDFKFSFYFYNRVSCVGALLSCCIVVFEMILFGFDSVGSANAFLKMVAYIILPPFLMTGLILIPVGAYWKRLRIARGNGNHKPFVFFFDPNKRTHRNAFAVFLLGTVLFLLMTMIGSYRAYHDVVLPSLLREGSHVKNP